ncbi:hypothetical protein [Pontibacter akesuensis]|uniref:Uncharacterized protein n=1 Tax=Pontibacter akesuensis TaxID=388950 RepID=A0A1I7K4T2_9BACT|nr:hypothetical protein [Pontibacter akesuensis]GHA75071.1 hypothetical protein GCM10007389_31130 [Pontibacter akesuensis]SFU92428.1 hypothetical protein SAMN04487941_3393 [Pontibacter akesuensis]
MRKVILPAFAIATLFLTTSCYEEISGFGTTTETQDSNDDEEVNPLHIRGYGDREPGTGGPRAPQPNQYYAFSTTGLESATRRELENSVAIEMVKVYYDPDMQLSDLDKRYNKPGATPAPTPDAAEAVRASEQADGAAPADGTGNGNNGNGNNGNSGNNGNGDSGNSTTGTTQTKTKAGSTTGGTTTQQ